MMKLPSTLTITGAAFVSAMLGPQAARAGGIELYEIATPDVGLASAGYAARAQDPSTLFKNPAGMSLLAGPQVQGGLQLTYGDVKFSPNSNTSQRLGSDDGGNAIGAVPAASFFVTTPVSERLTVGLGSFSYFGLAETYNDNWVGRYYVQESTLVGVSLMPAASVKVTDWLFIGGGPNFMYGYLKDKTAVNNLDPALGDGQLEVKDEEWGFGGVGGILLQPREGTRIGVTYVSQVKLNFAATPSFSGLGPALSSVLASPRSLSLGITVPQSILFGFYQELGPKWALMADVGWQNWHRFGEVAVGVDSSTPGGPQRVLTTQLHFQDTWHGALGAQYKLSPNWRLSAGFAYDSSAEEDANRSVVLPMGPAWRFGLGAEYQVTPKLNLGAAYEFLWTGDLPVDQGSDRSVRGRVAGSFNNSWFSFFALSATYKF